MRWLACICIVAALGGCKEDIYFIPGTGTLPDCDDTPIIELNDTLWFDQGTLTIATTGCLDTAPDDTFMSWSGSAGVQNTWEGRLCGDQLHLRGGWWLPVVDEDVGYCTYEDDSADEVGIMSEGNVLTVTSTQMTGTLVVQGSCRADYEVTFERVRDPSLN